MYKISNIITKYLTRINPEIALIPSSNDLHVDHKLIFMAAKVSMRTNEHKNLKKFFLMKCFPKLNGMKMKKVFNPNYFVSLSKSQINNKINAFLKYKSQNKKFPHPRSKETILNLSKVRGSQVHALYAEAFKVEKILD